MVKWTGPEPKLTLAQLEECIDVRVARGAIPTDAQLAEKFGVTPGTVREYMRGRYPKRYWAELRKSKTA